MNQNKKTAQIKLKVMPYNLHIILILLSMISFSASVSAESKEWKTEISDNGKTTVQWRISKNHDGLPLIDYISTSTADVSMQQLISVFKDVRKHKIFNDDKDSKELSILSENESIIYYYLGTPWPLKDSEIVARMVFTEDSTKKVAIFKITADPNIDLPRIKNVNRFTVYDLTYTFKDLGKGHSEISVTSKTVAPFNVPAWLINASFPDGPAGTIKKLVKLSR